MVAETAAESAEIGPARARPPTKLFRSWKPQLEREQIQRFSACCLAYVLLGWFDGANGALLPYIQEHYDIGYNVVALLFIANFVGAITTTGLNVWITTRLGMGKVLPLAALISALGFALAAAKLPFPAMCIGFGLLGFGNTAQDALCNAYTAGLPRLDFQLAILHTFYGLGAATSPLIATVFVTHGRPFNLFFLTSVGISILNIASLCVAFKFQHQLEEPTAQSAEIELSGMARTASREGEQNGPEAEVSELPTVGQRQYHVPLLVALKVYYVPLGAFWFLLYVGAEVANGGWIVSFLLEKRGGSPDVGYVSTGFFLGMTVSRFLLIPLNRFLGDRTAVLVYLTVALALEFIVWFGKGVISAAVAVSLVGFMFGPAFPIGIAVLTKLLPRSYLVGAIGTVTAMSAVGAAFVPYIVGALSQRFSVSVLPPVEVIVVTVMIGVWLCIPKEDKKRRE